MYTDTRPAVPGAAAHATILDLPAIYIADPAGVDPSRALAIARGGSQSAVLPDNDPDAFNHRLDLWLRARADWLAAKQRKSGSAATVRAYQYAWDDLFVRFLPQYSGRLVGPWEVGKAHITAWQQDLEAYVIPQGQRNAGQHLTDATINARLAAISSYYSYCTTVFTVIDARGLEVPLHHHNPAHAVPRAATTPYEKSYSLSAQQTRALLNKINRSTLRGSRDYALILTYLYTGRRSREIVNLKWSDITLERGRPGYRWHGKGGKTRRDELPMPAYQAILDYLRAAGRLDTIRPDDHIWTALTDHATRLPNVAAHDPAAHITTGMVNQIVRKRAIRVGIDPSQIHTHTLRHTAAMLRREAGDDPLVIQQYLAHSSLAVTQIYLQSREVREDVSWTKVEQLLGH